MSDTLKQIVQRFNIAEDQIPAITAALSIKTDRPSENQLKGVEQVCELMQSGASLEEAAETVLKDARAKKTAKDSSAIATQAGEIVAQTESVPSDIKSQIDAVAEAVGPVAVPDFVALVTEEAIGIEDGIRAYSRQALITAIAENPRQQGTPEDAVALFHKKQAERAAQRGN